MDEYHRHINALAYKTVEEHDLKVIARTVGIDPDQYTKMELIQKFNNY